MKRENCWGYRRSDFTELDAASGNNKNRYILNMTREQVPGWLFYKNRHPKLRFWMPVFRDLKHDEGEVKIRIILW